MLSEEQTVTRWALIIMVIIVGAIAFSATVLTLLFQVNDLTQDNIKLNVQLVDIVNTLEDCTTPGPNPIDDEGNTGHK